MTEQLRMEAAVVDKFSGPLKALKDRLGEIKSPEALKQMHERFEGVHSAVEKLTEAVKVGLEPAMNGLGIAGLSVAGALAGAAQAARVFSETTNNLRHLSNETGTTINSIRTLEALFNRLGVGASTTDSALSGFADKFREIQLGVGSTYGWLKDADPGFAAQLRGAKNYTEAVQDALSWLKRIRNEQDARSASSAIFGTPDMARVREWSDKELHENFEKAKQNLGSLGDGAVEFAKKYEDAIADLREKLTGFRDAIGSEVLPVMTKMVDEVGKFFDANKESISGGIISFIHGVESFDWGGLVSNLRTTITGLNDFATAMGGWSHVFEGLAALKVAETILPIAAALVSLAGGITSVSTALNGLALPKFIEFMAAMGVNGSVLAAGGALGVVGGAAALIKGSNAAQQPGKGGQYSAATPESMPEDQARLADMRARLDDVNSRIATTTGRSKNADALATLLGPLNDEKATIEGQIKILEQSLKDAQTKAMKEGAEEGLKKATPEAKKTIGEWFGSLFKSDYESQAPAGATARLIQASYGGGGFGGLLDRGGFGGSGGGQSASRGRSRGAGQSSSASGSASGSDESFPAGNDTSKLDWSRMGKQMGAKASVLIGRLKQLGLEPFQAAGAIGNSWAESNFKTDAFNPRLEHSHGLFQLNEDAGRWQPYLAWARKNGRDPHDPLAQTDYAKVEASRMAGPNGMSVWDAMRRAKTRTEATSIWLNYFEKPKVRDLGNRDHLAAMAESAYNKNPYDPSTGSGIAGRAYPQDWRRAAQGYSGMNIGQGGFLNGAQLNADGHVTVNLNNFPNSVRASASTEGFFKSTKINRGRTMATPGEDV